MGANADICVFTLRKGEAYKRVTAEAVVRFPVCKPAYIPVPLIPTKAGEVKQPGQFLIVPIRELKHVLYFNRTRSAILALQWNCRAR